MVEYCHGADGIKTRAGSLLVQYHRISIPGSQCKVTCVQKNCSGYCFFTVFVHTYIYNKPVFSWRHGKTGSAARDRDLASPHVLHGAAARLSEQGALGLEGGVGTIVHN